MTNWELKEEAERVLRLAQSTYATGTQLVAIYRNGPLEIVHTVVDTRKDLQPTILTKGVVYYLRSVQRYETWMEKKAHEEAKKRQSETLAGTEELEVRENRLLGEKNHVRTNR